MALSRLPQGAHLTDPFHILVNNTEADVQSIRLLMEELGKSITSYKPANLGLTSINTLMNTIQFVQRVHFALDYPLPTNSDERDHVKKFSESITTFMRSCLANRKRYYSHSDTVCVNYGEIIEKVSEIERQTINIIQKLFQHLPSTANIRLIHRMLLFMRKINKLQCPLTSNIYLNAAYMDLAVPFAQINFHIYNLTMMNYSTPTFRNVQLAPIGQYQPLNLSQTPTNYPEKPVEPGETLTTSIMLIEDDLVGPDNPF